MLDMSVRAKVLQLLVDLKRTSASLTSTSPTTWRRRAISATGSPSCTSAGSWRSAPRTSLPQPASSLHPRPARGHPRARSRAPHAPPPAPRRGARRHRPAARVLVPSPLPRGLRAVRVGEPRPAQPARDAVGGAGARGVPQGARCPRGSPGCRHRRWTSKSPPLPAGPAGRWPPCSEWHRRPTPRALWKGVAQMEPGPTGVRVRFRDHTDPVLRDGGSRARPRSPATFTTPTSTEPGRSSGP